MSIVILAIISARPFGEETEMDKPDRFPMPTMGGKQLWADELIFHDWRIQRNVMDGTCRLLDGNNWRHSSGTFEHCREVLDGIKRDRKLPPMDGKAVVVLHGLGRSRSSMNAICNYLRNNGGYRIVNVEYPTTQYNVANHAKTIRRLVNHLDGVEQINFIAHSMGNIVIRHYLGDLERAEAGELSAADRRAMERFGRFVMLAPPNQGSQLAEIFANNLLFKQIAGDAGQELGRRWPEVEKRLAKPRFQFGIIAGGNGKQGYNPILDGDNDGVISTDTAKLAGARDFIVVPSMHSFIMDKVQVQKYALNFLRHGSFVSETDRHPLEYQP